MLLPTFLSVACPLSLPPSQALESMLQDAEQLHHEANSVLKPGTCTS